MNNKGQSLVSFVLIVPVVLLILYMVYEVGQMSLLKNELDDINYLAMDYAIDNITDADLENKIKDLIIKNKDSIDDINVLLENDKIYIKLTDKLDKQIISSKNNIFQVKSSYVGYIENDKKIIEREK